MLLREDLKDEDIPHRTEMTRQAFEARRAALHEELSVRIHLALAD